MASPRRLPKSYPKKASTSLSRLRNCLPPLKDSKDPLLDSGVYKILCSCGVPYIGETDWAFNTRIQEHGADIKHERTQKSALAEDYSTTKHHICLENMQILSKEDNYFKRKFEEAIEINYHPMNLNRDDGWSINPSWQPLLSLLSNNLYPCF